MVVSAAHVITSSSTEFCGLVALTPLLSFLEGELMLALPSRAEEAVDTPIGWPEIDYSKKAFDTYVLTV